jgi:membrane protein YdbS with pleckstrin-like domain
VEANERSVERVMTPLDPRQLTVLRIRGAMIAAAAAVPLIATELGMLSGSVLPPGLLVGVALLIAILAVIVLPARRYRGWGYAEQEDELHVRSGLLVRVLTVVPLARVQHIDVARGPLERRYGLATLVLHTAGTRGAIVSLPGLAHEEAGRLRDHVRGQIRQDLA